VLDLIDLWDAKAGDDAARAILKQLILDECRQEKEFSLAVQSFVRARTGWDVG
jgi:hypothetical protein